MAGYGRTVKEKRGLRSPTKVAKATGGGVDWCFPGMAFLR